MAFFRDRTRAFWRQGETLRQVETERPAIAALPVSARIEQADWLETFLPFAPVQGWSEVHSAFLVPKVQLVFAFDGDARAAGRRADDRGRMSRTTAVQLAVSR